MIQQTAESSFLVLGDWLVDEHWVAGVHRSLSSSRTGRMHLRVIHEPDDVVQSFCGAGRTAYFLHHAYHDPDSVPDHNVLGLGLWHRGDTAALKSLFDLSAPPHTMHRLTTRQSSDGVKGIELFNINDVLNHDTDPDVRDRDEYTTRVIRLYQRQSDEIVYDRLDWERNIDGKARWTPTCKRLLSQKITALIEKKNVPAVLIKDLGKGAVTSDVLWALTRNGKLRTANWYISTKVWRPSWLMMMRTFRARIPFLLIPSVAAEGAIRQGELSSWITHAGRPSNEAIKLISELHDTTGADRIIVLPGHFTALAVDFSNASRPSCVVQPRRASKHPVEMGGASIFFPAVVACLEHPEGVRLGLREVVGTGLSVAREWTQGEAGRVLNPRQWNPNPRRWEENRTFRLMQDWFAEKEKPTFDVPDSLRVHDWNDELRQWSEAVAGIGTIAPAQSVVESGRPHRTTRVERRVRTAADGQPTFRTLELWRAMAEVNEYICCDHKLRRRLKELLIALTAFTRNPTYHVSGMLVAAPGSGKTFLAKRLAKQAHLDFIAFNVTQMRSLADVTQCFATIVAKQDEIKPRRLLVFVDEINAELGGEPVYSAFLSPLEDGTYVHDGHLAHIRPCTWLFAGTDRPAAHARAMGGSRARERAKKGSDFTSRLTLGIVDLMNRHVSDLERVYLGASLLKAEFPEIKYVSEHVLQAFRFLSSNVTIRELKHFVRRFENVQYEIVLARNVPPDWPMSSRNEKSRDRWLKWCDKQRLPETADISLVTLSV